MTVSQNADLAAKINDAVTPISNAVNDVIFYSVDLFGVSVPLVVVWLIAAAIIITFSLRFVNLTGFGHALALVSGRRTHHLAEGSGEISHFQALSSALSGTVDLAILGRCQLRLRSADPALFSG